MEQAQLDLPTLKLYKKPESEVDILKKRLKDLEYRFSILEEHVIKKESYEKFRAHERGEASEDLLSQRQPEWANGMHLLPPRRISRPEEQVIKKVSYERCNKCGSVSLCECEICFGCGKAICIC
jgi:hypothetical protein